MPNRKTHITVGVLVGIGAGAWSARTLPDKQRTVEIACAGIGGWLGGIAPDVIEPATSPNHRGPFHSAAAATLLTKTMVQNWPASFRARGVACESKALAAPVGSEVQANEQLKSFLWHCAAGLAVGFLAGYAAHLALDMGTTRNLPLLTG